MWIPQYVTVDYLLSSSFWSYYNFGEEAKARPDSQISQYYIYICFPKNGKDPIDTKKIKSFLSINNT